MEACGPHPAQKHLPSVPARGPAKSALKSYFVLQNPTVVQTMNATLSVTKQQETSIIQPTILRVVVFHASMVCQESD